MAESLSRKLRAELVVGSILGIKATRGVDNINHALFADDSLLLGGESLNIARAFNEIYKFFVHLHELWLTKVRVLFMVGM